MPPLTVRAKNAADAADRAEILAAFKNAGGGPAGEVKAAPPWSPV